VYDDFGCALRRRMLYQGRLYLTENYCCFYSSLVGMSEKLVIPLADVTKLRKSKMLGMISNSILLEQGGKQHIFTNFTNRDLTFNFLHKLWSKVSPHAEQGDPSDSEEEEDLIAPSEELESRRTMEIEQVSKKTLESLSEFKEAISEDAKSPQEQPSDG